MWYTVDFIYHDHLRRRHAGHSDCPTPWIDRHSPRNGSWVTENNVGPYGHIPDLSSSLDWWLEVGSHQTLAIKLNDYQYNVPVHTSMWLPVSLQTLPNDSGEESITKELQAWASFQHTLGRWPVEIESTLSHAVADDEALLPLSTVTTVTPGLPRWLGEPGGLNRKS